jgi:regulator of RNase E activity RraA
VIPGARAVGRVLPARHYGSVDVFLEALQGAEPGDVLVVDNGGRRDEACVGDLVVLEAQVAHVTGVLVWGAYRDAAVLRGVGLPVFAYGTCSAGPRRVDPREPEALDSVRFGEHVVGRGDVAFADDDGALFVPADRAKEVIAMASEIAERERRQAAAVRKGNTLREQFRFADYLARRREDPSITFRQHLRELEAEIEE